MPKSSSPDLFLLIKELNKNEKGYIKKTAFRQAEDSLFIKLFNAIDIQKEYDEKKLLAEEKYIRQLPRLKNYLYEKILGALETYHSIRNKDIQVRQFLSRTQVLFDKGFYEQCEKILNKAKVIAEKFERFSQLLEILEWERILTIEKLVVKDIEKLSEEEQVLLKKMENLSQYKLAYDKISALYTKTIFIRTDKEDKSFKKIISGPTFKDEKHAQSLTAKILFYKIHCKYHSALDNRKEYLHYARKAVALMESNKEYTNQNLLQYIKVLNNLIVTLSENRKFREFNEAILKLRTIPEAYPAGDSKKMRSIVHMRAVIREFYHYVSIGDYDKSHQFIPSIQDGINRYRSLISTAHLMIFYYAIAYSYFIHGNCKSSLLWVNKIINTKVSEETIAFHAYARILAISIHFELQNENLLEYFVRSTKRFLKKHGRYYQFEQIFISFFEKNMEALLKEKRENALFVKLKEEFRRLKDKKELIVLEYFDFPAWTESKIRHCSYREMLEKDKG
jgi:hypothetical protein